MSDDQAKRIIEALLFASEHPVTLKQFGEVLKSTEGDIAAAIEELRSGYAQAGHAFTIVQVAGGYQMATDPQYAPWIKKLFRGMAQERVTTPALETLAIVAYRQPITRVEIEALRGVNVDGVMHTLLERGLIKILGRKETVGRPILYGTTKEFLQHFGLNALADLPRIEELTQPNQGVGQPTAVAAVQQPPPS